MRIILFFQINSFQTKPRTARTRLRKTVRGSYLSLIASHKRKKIVPEDIVVLVGRIERLFVVQIIAGIHRFINDAIHFNGSILRAFIGMIQPNALAAVVANLRWIEIAHITFAALDAYSII